MLVTLKREEQKKITWGPNNIIVIWAHFVCDVVSTMLLWDPWLGGVKGVVVAEGGRREMGGGIVERVGDELSVSLVMWLC